jgi:hypothetical protein
MGGRWQLAAGSYEHPLTGFYWTSSFYCVHRQASWKTKYISHSLQAS